jgi:hypothetical protein
MGDEDNNGERALKLEITSNWFPLVLPYRTGEIKCPFPKGERGGTLRKISFFF